MLNVAVAQPILKSPRVVPRVRQGIAAGVPEHMRVDREGHLGARADALNQAVHGGRREWAAALGREYEGRVGELPAQLAQCADLIAPQWVNGRLAVLEPPDMK